ncbi:DUF1963 domain-containing protein [Sphingomonas parva]|nr:DUF1963 domain-containing protein [Sphingomonas parva]
MSEDAFEFMFRRHRRDAILLHRSYPPHCARRTNSKFGGLPRLPDGVEWPRTPNGTPLHFLLQIDCADLPFRSSLPESGVLFFFARDDESLDWDIDRPPEEACRVLHVRAAPPATPLRQPPSDIPPIGGAYRPHGGWRDTLREGENGPSFHVEWPIEPLAMDSWPSWLLEDDAAPGAGDRDAGLAPLSGKRRAPELDLDPARQRRYADALDQRRKDAFARATGMAPPDFRVDEDRQSGRTIFFHAQRGVAAYPQHWATIRYAARLVLRQLAVRPYADPGLVARLPAEAEAWLARAASHDLDTSVCEADRADFRAWLLALRLTGDDSPLSAEAARLVYLSMLATIRCWAGDAERAARIAPEAYETMAAAFSAPNIGGQVSYMLGHPPVVPQLDRPDDPAVCLLTLASEQALGWQWGDIDNCVFWVGTAALAGGDFTGVRAALEG